MALKPTTYSDAKLRRLLPSARTIGRRFSELEPPLPSVLYKVISFAGRFV